MDTPILELSSLYYSYSGNKDILSDISLKLLKGDIFFLIGANGAGKSTLIKNIAGIVNPDYGSLSIDGIEMIRKNRLELMHKIGILLDSTAFYKHLTVLENAYIIGSYYEISKCEIKEILEVLGLKDYINQKSFRLSAGLKQRLALALSMIHRPPLIILDEPTNGLDPQGITDFRELVIKLNQNFNITFFITTHILNEAEKLAKNIAIIHKGQVIDYFSLEELKDLYQVIRLFDVRKEDVLKTFDFPDGNIFYYKNGNILDVLIPKSLSLGKLNFLDSNQAYNILNDVPLETYYLAKCNQYDQSLQK